MDYDEFEDEYIEEALMDGTIVRHRVPRGGPPPRKITMRELAEWISGLDFKVNQAMAMAMSAGRVVREPIDPLKITLPVAETLKEVARESVRQSIQRMASKDLITEQAERAIQQSIVKIIEDAVGRHTSTLNRGDAHVLKELKERVAEPLRKTLDDNNVMSNIVDKALKQVEHIFDPHSSWTREVVERTVKELEEEVHQGIRDGIRERAKALTERVLSEVIDSALREEMPALDQLQALLMLGIGNRS